MTHDIDFNSENLDQNNTDTNEILISKVVQVVSKEENIAESVRRLTYEALSSRKIDFDTLRQIINSVVDGVQKGIKQRTELTATQMQSAKYNFNEAIQGLDIALAQFAQASKFTIEEAVSKARTFTQDDLISVRSDLEKLESVFLDTLRNFSKVSEGFVSETLHDIISHAENQGTAVGAQLKETLATLASHIAQGSGDQLKSGIHLAQETANFMRNVASGVLAGLADRLKIHQE